MWTALFLLFWVVAIINAACIVWTLSCHIFGR
jgi:hypothetical protein